MPICENKSSKHTFKTDCGLDFTKSGMNVNTWI